MKKSLGKFDINVVDEPEWRSGIMQIKKYTPLLVIQRGQVRPRARRKDRDISVSVTMNLVHQVLIFQLELGTFRHTVRVLLFVFSVKKTVE